MRLWLSMFLVGLLASTVNAVEVAVQGEWLRLDPPARVLGGQVMVPLPVFERLGASAHYRPEDGTITLRRAGRTVSMRLGSSRAAVDGSPVTLPVPPLLRDGAVLVPLRVAGEGLGARVRWDRAADLISVDAPPLASRPVPLPPTAEADLISKVELETAMPPRTGGTVAVTMKGEPGGKARFHLATHRNLPMIETAPGAYRGSFRLGAQEQFSSRVEVVLDMPDGRTDRFVSSQSYEIYEPGKRLIQAASHDGEDVLVTGEELRVRATGIRGARMTFDVGSEIDLPMDEVAPGSYVGRFIPTTSQDSARVLVHLRTGEGRVESLEVSPTVDVAR
ncbi:MAG: copper amine oxidase N-terminal domain-containing protein [Armatimonadetes bacterium]|nr:copper amine oxidase N-terminal domain-containing protein [Armatimonadota bacterium]